MTQVDKIGGGRASPARHPSTTARAFPELSVVSLVRDIKADGRTFPAGSRGTVVAAYADGKGYEVELFDPVHGVITVETEDLAG